MGDKPSSTSTDTHGIIARLTSFISRVCQLPPKPRNLTQIRLNLERVSHLTRRQVTELIIVSLIISLTLAFVFSPRLILPDYPIKGTLTGPLTIWTRHIKLESDIVINGTNALVLDGVTIHNPSNYDIIVNDSGNLTIHNSKPSSTSANLPNFRVMCKGNSVVRVSNSTVGLMSVRNRGGVATIEADSYVASLAVKSNGVLKIVDSTIRRLLYSGYQPAMKPKLLNSTIKTLQVPVYVSCNFSIIGDVWSGEYDVMIDVDDDSVIEWPRYFLYVSGSVEGFIESPTAKLDSIIVHDSKVSLKSVNYSSIPYSYLEEDTYAPGVTLDAYDSHISMFDCNFGWAGGWGAVTNKVRLYGSSQAEVSKSVIGFIKIYDHSNFTASQLNAMYCDFYDNSFGHITDSNGYGIALQRGMTVPQRWKGIIEYVKANDNATVNIANITVKHIHYESMTLTKGESIGYVPLGN